jgi:hypothetical protein
LEVCGAFSRISKKKKKEDKNCTVFGIVIVMQRNSGRRAQLQTARLFFSTKYAKSMEHFFISLLLISIV